MMSSLPHSGANRCLVADDSKTIRRVIARIVQEYGYIVFEACDGAQAIELCLSQPPALILLDWNMPVMDGITCLRKLRSLPLEPRPTIIVCTTESSLDRIHEALEAGADEYIMKPFEAEILFDKLVQLGLQQPQDA